MGPAAPPMTEAGSVRLDVARFTLLRLNNLFLERSGRR
jgi:hypothetical protein